MKQIALAFLLLFAGCASQQMVPIKWVNLTDENNKVAISASQDLSILEYHADKDEVVRLLIRSLAAKETPPPKPTPPPGEPNPRAGVKK